MSWKPIVAGVDLSPEGAAASAVASMLGNKASANVTWVHAALDVSATMAHVPGTDLDVLTTEVAEAARRQIERQLAGSIPAEDAARVVVRTGNAAQILPEVVREQGAGLLVVGGKHHSVAARWLGGSTVSHLLRTADVPILVTVGNRLRFQRIVVAVDFSDALPSTLRAALSIGRLFDSEVSVLHVVEPLPYDYASSIHQPEEHLREFEHSLRAAVEEVVGSNDLDCHVRFGHVAKTLAFEASKLQADLIVIGAHGKGFVDRLLVGSTTQRLLNRLPTSMLVIPAGAMESGAEVEFEAVEHADRDA